MAVELAVGYVSVVPSARGFGRSLIRTASSAGDSASSAFGSRFTSGMSRVARRAALAFTAGLGTAGFFAVRTAADFEQTRIAFEGILGDVEKANSLLSDLRDFAAKTPFEFTDLSTAARQLLAVGVASEDIIPTMTVLGNVAATLGAGKVEIEGTVRALGQMKGKGRTSAEELRQISEQLPGFSAIGAIAEGLGVSVSEAFKLVESGAVSGDEGIRLILQGMQNFPGAAGAMERQSKTLNGVLSTFKDTLATTAIDFITPYLPALASGVQSFSGFIERDLVPRLQTFVGWIGDLTDRYGPGLADFFTNTLAPAVSDFVTGALQSLGEWWGRNREDIIGFLEEFGRIAFDVFDRIQGIIRDYVVPALADFGGWFVDNGGHTVFIMGAIAAAFFIWAVNAALAAIATAGALWPVLLLVGAVALLTAGTNWLIEKFDLLPKAVTAFQWLLDYGVMPLKRAVESLVRTVEDAWDLLANPPALTDIVPGFGGTDLADEARASRRAKGGPVTAGMPYVVGEERPELFIPNVSGTILPEVPTGEGGVNLHVTQWPGEDQVSAGMRALRHHQRIQLEVAGR